MIVNFDTRRGRLQMHGEAAVALLRLMGHSGGVPGAIMAADLPEALKQLRHALETAGEQVIPSADPADDRDDDAAGESGQPGDAVKLRTRALPLIELIEGAIAGQSDLMWDRA